MMQFINTFEGVKTRCVCKPDQTLFSATTNKNGKKRSGHARLRKGHSKVRGTVTLYYLLLYAYVYCIVCMISSCYYCVSYHVYS